MSSVTNRNDDTSSINQDGKRRSSRRSHNNDGPGNDDLVDTTPVAKKLRFSPRNFKHCTDINGLPVVFHCSGCVAFKDFGTKERGEYTTKKHQCFKAWTKDENKVQQRMIAHVLAVKDHIENQLHITASTLLIDESPLIENETNITPTTTTTAPIAPAAPTPPTRKIDYEMNPVHSQGQCFEFNIPNAHAIVHKNYLSRVENESEILRKVRQKTQQKQHKTNSVLAQGLWAIAFAACPALALSAAQFLIPLIIYAFFYDTGLFDFKKFNQTKHAKSFPSGNTLRKCCSLQAARDTMLLGNELRNTKTCMSCDKGNKKGVGHLVKYVSWWFPGKVLKRLLDIDGSGGTGVECAAGIQCSMNKLKNHNDDLTHLLYGTATDSGGGGTLESLYDQMVPLGLCAPEDEYLITNCLIHAVQLQLKNAVCAAFGEGALDKINAMQLLHSVWRLQQSVDLEEWRHMLCLSSQFVLSYDPEAIDYEGCATAQKNNRIAFYKNHDKVLQFHSKFKKLAVDPEANTTGTVLQKMLAPILTRWWTVGAGASFVFDYYLVFFHACQTIINMHDSTSTPNGIASDLFAMMLDPENFFDVVLIRCFNKAYVNQHFDWMQTCKDLTDCLGFQAHNVVVRHFIMDRGIRSVMYGASMEDYHEAANKVVALENDGVVDIQKERTRHLKKLEMFLHEAHDSLHKHFPRWLQAKLLPAALLSEGLMARVVAAAMLNRNAMPTFTAEEGVVDCMRTKGYLEHYSEAHKETINLCAFDCFIRNQLEKQEQVVEHTPQVMAAAERLCLGTVNLRDINYDNDNGNGELRWHLHSTYLPVASFLQFVESGVKEAKHASATDRSEIIRSCLAVIRSATPLGRTKSIDEKLSFLVNKTLAILQSAVDRSAPHEDWIDTQVDHSCDTRFDQVHYSLTKGHFHDARVNTKRARVDNEGSKFKRQNVNQKQKKQTLAAAVTGLIPYGKLAKARNMLDLEEELLFRGIPIEEIPTTVSERKEMLKNLEIERLTDEGVR